MKETFFKRRFKMKLYRNLNTFSTFSSLCCVLCLKGTGNESKGIGIVECISIM